MGISKVSVLRTGIGPEENIESSEMIPFDVLDHSVEATDHNQSAFKIEDKHVPAPMHRSSHCRGSGIVHHQLMKNDRDGSEEAEEDNLHDKTDDDNVFAEFRAARRFSTRHQLIVRKLIGNPNLWRGNTSLTFTLDKNQQQIAQYNQGKVQLLLYSGNCTLTIWQNTSGH